MTHVSTKTYIAIGTVALGTLLGGNAEAGDLTGSVKAGYNASEDNNVAVGKAFFMDSYGENLNPSLELIAGSDKELDFGVILGNRHGSEDGHVGYFLGAESEGDNLDITAGVEGHVDKLFKGGTDAYLRLHAGDLADGVDIGVIARLLEGKNLGLKLGVNGHIYDTERLDSVNGASVDLIADWYVTDNLKLSAGAKYLSNEDLVGGNVMANAGLSWSFGAGNAARSSFYTMPCDYGLDLNQLDLGKNHTPVKTIDANGAVTTDYMSQDELDTAVDNGTVITIYDNDSATFENTQITGDFSYEDTGSVDSEDSSEGGTSTSGGNTGGTSDEDTVGNGNDFDFS